MYAAVFRPDACGWRPDKQHIMFMEVMGKYPPPMAEVLADDTPGEQKTCVDLGCGSGSWSVAVLCSRSPGWRR